MKQYFKKFGLIMNKYFFVSMLLSIIMLCTLVTNQTVFAQKMTLKVTTEGNYYNVLFKLAGSGDVTINWGDTKTDKDFLGPNPTSFSHNYTQKGSRTITITGADVVYMDCNNNQITSLDVSKNIELRFLYCHNNQITNLDVSKNIKLEYLVCSPDPMSIVQANLNKMVKPKQKQSKSPYQPLKSLKLSNNPELEYLDCSRNQLTTLDVSKNTKLKRLVCVNNRITSLNLSNNPELESLDCNNNRITKLNVNNKTELKKLDCSKNELTSLDVSNNENLQTLNCENNKLSYPALSALFESLPENSIKRPTDMNDAQYELYKMRNNIQSKEIKISGNSGINNCDKSIATNKGWEVNSNR